MWIQVNNDLVNLSVVRHVWLKPGIKGKFLVCCDPIAGTGTMYLSFDTETEARDVLDAIEAVVCVGLGYVSPNRPAPAGVMDAPS